MTLKIVHGLVGTATRAHSGVNSSAQDAGRPSSQQVTVVRTPASDAVVTSVATSVRRVTVGENISSYDKARDVAKDVAERIRKEGESEAHQGLETLGGSGVVRQHFV